MPKLKETAVSKYRKQFPAIESPEERAPKMPLRMSDLTPAELGNYMSEYSAWREFTEDLLIEADSNYIELQEKYDNLLKQELLLAYSGNQYKTKEEKKWSVETKEEFVNLREEVLQAELYKDMLGNKFESLTNAINTLSREITRRSNVNFER